jgi:hypothetical protein
VRKREGLRDREPQTAPSQTTTTTTTNDSRGVWCGDRGRCKYVPTSRVHCPPPLVTLTLTNVTAPLFSDASCAKCGAIILHGPHHLLTTTERTGWGWGRCESRESGRAYTKMALPLLFRAKNERAPPPSAPSPPSSPHSRRGKVRDDVYVLRDDVLERLLALVQADEVARSRSRGGGGKGPGRHGGRKRSRRRGGGRAARPERGAEDCGCEGADASGGTNSARGHCLL